MLIILGRQLRYFRICHNPSLLTVLNALVRSMDIKNEPVLLLELSEDKHHFCSATAGCEATQLTFLEVLLVPNCS